MSDFNPSIHWGLDTGIDLHNCEPKLIRSKPMIKLFIDQLCELIQMKKYGDAQIIHFGQDDRVAGYSFTQLIETSLISGHFRNENNRAYINVFSCKHYDVNDAAKFALKFFEADKVITKINLRE